MNSGRKDTGSSGEDSAAIHVSEHGFSILSRNYRAGRYGEIDMIGRSGNLIVFFEVKTRNSDRHGGALYSVGKRKIDTLKYCARHYIHHALGDTAGEYIFRFDLISIQNGRIEWVEDIVRR